MALHVDRDEYRARMSRLQAAMKEAKLDALLLFQQESMLWLTGYDTFGFCFFQSMLVTADGRMTLLTRSADRLQAKLTSIVDDVRVWRDAPDAAPERELRAIADEHGLRGARIGVEYDSYGLSAAWGRRLDAAFAAGEGAPQLEDASRLVSRLRAVKSDAEIAFVREAARLSDLADRAAIERLAPGADEGAILAAQHVAIFEAGGDYPANEFIIGSGAEALLCRYKSGRRRLDADDQITLEFAGSWRRYHAAIMRTHLVGRVGDRHRCYHGAAREALLACEDAMRPGAPAGDVFSAHARVLDAHGLGQHKLNACGYSLGAKFTPSWMDPPMFYEANPWRLEPGMVMFAHMILMDEETGTAMCLGRTSLVTEGGAEPLNAPDLDLVAR